MSPTEPAATFSRLPGWRSVVLVALVVATYANSLDGDFLLDDEANIYIPEVRDPLPLGRILNHPRPLATATFALNYALSPGLEHSATRGYHAFNVCVHAAAALLLLGLVRRTLELPQYRDRFGATAGDFALAVAAIWAVHPLTTQAVTYIVQRMEAMMAMFYLLTLYGLLRGATAETRAGGFGWYAVAVAASVLSMASKQVGVTIPAVAILYDRCFLSGSFRSAVARRWPLYLLLAAASAALVLAFSANASPTAQGGANLSAGFGMKNMTVWDYARSQPGVILYYLRLAAWPYPLCLDYGWEVARGPVTVVLSSAVIAGMVFASLRAVVKSPAVGFLGSSFFLVLAPTSSILPIADLAVEHRMYLPLAAVVVLAVLAADRVLRRTDPRTARLFGAGAAAAAVVVLAAVTIRRNEVYRSVITMWQDVVSKSPTNTRAQYNLGLYLFADGRTDEAVPHLEAATELMKTHPRLGVDVVVAHNNLASVLSRRGKYAAAAARYRQALEVAPNASEIAEIESNLALALAEMGQFEEVESLCRHALSVNPEHPTALRALAKLESKRGNFADSARYYERAVKAEPKNLAGNLGLAITLRRLGRYDEALTYHRAALTGDPTDVPANNQYGLTLMAAGRPKEAADAFAAAVRLAPRDPRYHGNLAAALDADNRTEEADAEYRMAIEIEPAWPQRVAQAAWELATSPEPGARNGLEAFLLAVQLNRVVGPADRPTAKDMLAAAYAANGKYSEAAKIAKQAAAEAEATGRNDLADKIRERQALYETGKPYIRAKPAGG